MAESGVGFRENGRLGGGAYPVNASAGGALVSVVREARHTDAHALTRSRKHLPSPTANALGIALGQRIASQRKGRDITQVELAERLRISQQAMNSFEKTARRCPHAPSGAASQ
jgi:DNA-binding XRE family transcriptional regulator